MRDKEEQKEEKENQENQEGGAGPCMMEQDWFPCHLRTFENPGGCT